MSNYLSSDMLSLSLSDVGLQLPWEQQNGTPEAKFSWVRQNPTFVNILSSNFRFHWMVSICTEAYYEDTFALNDGFTEI
jgi:hypothetical protein